MPASFLIFLLISLCLATKREEIFKLVILSIADNAVIFSEIQAGFLVAILVTFFLYKLFEFILKSPSTIILMTPFF